MADAPDLDTYALTAAELPGIAAPDLPYQPPRPRSWRPRIALVGAGGISVAHLAAYREMGLDVVVIANRTLAKAEAKRDEFFPHAEATDDIHRTLTRDDIAVVDLTPHPDVRLPMIETALAAGKHVLSQKPFVTDLDAGARLVALARENSVKLAVNQNGRWAPYQSWTREAVKAGLLGKVHSVDSAMYWDHGWVAGTPFEEIDDLLLYDFAIHRFDFLVSLIGGSATSVFASVSRAEGQRVRPALNGRVVVAFPGGLASLTFDGATGVGPSDRLVVTGSHGTVVSQGADLNVHELTFATASGRARPALSGSWFREGFVGCMGALLAAVEDGGEPQNGARGNLDTLALTLAAVASSRRRVAVAPGEVRSLAQAMAEPVA
jgi:predicted dehydrogenase